MKSVSARVGEICLYACIISRSGSQVCVYVLLYRLCSGKILNSAAEVVQPQPYVKVKFVVQGGVGEFIRVAV